MKHWFSFIFLICINLYGNAQYKVVFTLHSYPLQFEGDSIFIAGNFNNWDPHNASFSLIGTQESTKSTTKVLPPGDYEYKCTRGSWLQTECDKMGNDITNHHFTITGDTSIEINIQAWKDEFKKAAKQHTTLILF